MKKYIFITPEGTTISPNGNDVENFQVIGTVYNAKNKDAALKTLLIQNDWIFDEGYNVAEFIVHEFL
jgi:hypothetical protein